MPQSRRDGTALATGLGWFSIGLGAAELFAPRMMASLIGTSNSRRARKTIRMFGAREIMAGALILSGPRRSSPLWMRVLGDALDLGALAAAMKHPRSDRGRLMFSMASVLGVTALDVVAGVMTMRNRTTSHEPVIASITVNRPPNEVYAAWRNFEQLARFMDWLDSVRDLGNGMTEWTARLPGGGRVTWRAVTIVDRPGERISWRTVEKAPVPLRGTVVFRPTLDRRGTEVEVEMQIDVPGSRRLGGMFARLATKEQIESDLRRFKQVLETGEVVHSDASIHRGPHPARPPAEIGASL